MGLPSGSAGQISLGGHYSLWRNFLVRWFEWMRSEASEIAIRTEAHTNSMVMQLLSDGMLDIGVTFHPEQRRGLIVEKLFEEELILVSTQPSSAVRPLEQGYLLVDWGPEFQKFHSSQFDEIPLPGLQTNLGAFGVELILGQGGSGYFPEPVLRPFLQNGRLHCVEDAPRFKTPIYVIYQDMPVTEPLRIALHGLRETAAPAS